MKSQRTQWEQKIIDLACQGLSNSEISNLLNIELHTISKYIHSLGVLNHPNYDLEIYQKIQMERNLRQRNIINKDLLDDIVSLVFAGFTYLEIAAMYENFTESDVNDYIYYLQEGKSIYSNPELYQKVTQKNAENIAKNWDMISKRLEKMEQAGLNLKKISSSTLFRKYKKVRKIQALILEFMESNMSLSDSYMATKYELSECVIQNIFLSTEYDSIILKVISAEEWTAIKNARRNKAAAARKPFPEIPETKRNLTDEEKQKLEKIIQQKDLWLAILFSFQLSIEDLGRLTHFESIEILTKVIYDAADRTNNFYVNGLNYLLSHRIATNPEEQEKRRKNAANFLKELGKAQMARDVAKYSQMIRWLTDADALDILKKKPPLRCLTEEQLTTLIEYRLKYAIPINYFPYTHDAIRNNTPEKYKEEMKSINEFNDASSKNAYTNTISKTEYLEKRNSYSKR